MTVNLQMTTLIDDAISLYKAPFSYKRGYIHDADHNTVADNDVDGGAINGNLIARVRGWGRIQYKEDAAKLQDTVGHIIADALTMYWEQRNAPQVPPNIKCAVCGEGTAHLAVTRNCDTCTSTYAGVSEYNLRRYLVTNSGEETMANKHKVDQTQQSAQDLYEAASQFVKAYEQLKLVAGEQLKSSIAAPASTKLDVWDVALTVVASVSGAPRSNLKLDTLLVDDLSLDSLDLVELVLTIEDAIDLEVNDDLAKLYLSVPNVKIVDVGKLVHATVVCSAMVPRVS